MPLYEYQCESCGQRFERIQKFSDPPIDTCPECGGVVRKLLSSPAIQFKGSGWYITDYAKKSSGDGARSTAESSDSAQKSDKGEKSDKTAKTDSTGASSDSTSSKPTSAAKE